MDALRLTVQLQRDSQWQVIRLSLPIILLSWIPLPSWGCPQPPILERFQRHQVRSGETLTQIAQRYNLLPATLMGANPPIRQGQVQPGQTLVVPPYNGILVSVPPGETLKSVAAIYRVRPDLLFEVNGCPTAPQVLFVPGVNWSPLNTPQNTAIAPLPQQPINRVTPTLQRDRYPLPDVALLHAPYGWQTRGTQMVFVSGLVLKAQPGTAVQAVADATVAHVGPQPTRGQLIVLNHAQGRQTRYANLGAVSVQIGQTVRRGQPLGTIATGQPGLHFELRYRSNLGWVAQDPTPYLQAIAPNR